MEFAGSGGESMGIFFETAVSHRGSIMSKLGAPNTASLVRKAVLEDLAFHR